MRRILCSWALAAAFMALPGAAGAKTTAGELRSWCIEIDRYQDSERFFGYAQCLGFLQGFIDWELFWRRDAWDGCMPPDVTNEQVRLIFVEYSAREPKYLNWSASLVLSRALHDAFGCGWPPSVAPD